ncbi:biliverdin-producing heme oxygenase [Legionella resiliens]|uniref:Biliverdin-producing heme oxygenase n=1 Tax=Legionella resiliens TaxID=2905958 RepID=A0ABS8X1W1_9GAMM|nr:MULTISPECIES: biliverdin-producing heme oxygenase [unclassified Legionella]MCE0722814.1 biliverdin-producing heme oxygenase [Legionella sp. 9fVS26]MCE3531967.1 biliverdin-producing heme oxygenase [Legionella sp. 8cVS16]
MFSKALLTSTYKNGKPGQRTDAHERAEHHRFKTEYLFKNPKIPKDLYVSRLIQHFFIIKAIETQLQSLSGTNKAEINAFFSLSYLQQLWRTSAIEEDLRQLGVEPETIQEHMKARTTQSYLEKIETLKPKALLAHFLLHVAGFMHGGNIIQSKYINPSNRLTSYKIPANQYDFFPAASFLSTENPIALYGDMMKQVDKITLDEDEYRDIFEQCTGIYATMASIYDDLCDMHSLHPNRFVSSLALLTVSMVAIAFIFKLMTDYLSPSQSFTPT